MSPPVPSELKEVSIQQPKQTAAAEELQPAANPPHQQSSAPSKADVKTPASVPPQQSSATPKEDVATLGEVSRQLAPTVQTSSDLPVHKAPADRPQKGLASRDKPEQGATSKSETPSESSKTAQLLVSTRQSEADAASRASSGRSDQPPSSSQAGHASQEDPKESIAEADLTNSLQPGTAAQDRLLRNNSEQSQRQSRPAPIADAHLPEQGRPAPIADAHLPEQGHTSDPLSETGLLEEPATPGASHQGVAISDKERKERADGNTKRTPRSSAALGSNQPSRQGAAKQIRDSTDSVAQQEATRHLDNKEEATSQFDLDQEKNTADYSVYSTSRQLNAQQDQKLQPASAGQLGDERIGIAQELSGSGLSISQTADPGQQSDGLSGHKDSGHRASEDSPVPIQSLKASTQRPSSEVLDSETDKRGLSEQEVRVAGGQNEPLSRLVNSLAYYAQVDLTYQDWMYHCFADSFPLYDIS